MSLFPPRPPPFLFARSAEFIIRLPPPPFASIVLLSTAKIYSLPPSLRSWNLLQSFLSLPFPRLSGGKAARRLSSDLEGGGGGGDRGRWHREREREREEGGREGRSLCGKRKRNTSPSSLLLQGTLFTTFVSSAYFSISPRIQKPFRGRGFSRGRSGGREGTPPDREEKSFPPSAEEKISPRPSTLSSSSGGTECGNLGGGGGGGLRFS